MNGILRAARGSGLLLVTAGVVLVLDQVTKHAATAYLGPGGQEERLNIVGSWVRLAYVTNSGAAFGVLQDRTLLFSIIAFLAIPVLLVFYNYLPGDSFIPRFCVGLLLGGTLGNLIDRIRFGYVVDFIDMGYGHLRWPTYNVADSAFVIGVFILAFYLTFLSTGRAKQSATSE